MSMNKEEILSVLRAHEAELHSHGIRHAALFGSIARGEQHDDSDIDILIELEPDEKRTIFGYADIKCVVADLFVGQVDVIDKDHMRVDLRDSVGADAIYAF